MVDFLCVITAYLECLKYSDLNVFSIFRTPTQLKIYLQGQRKGTILQL